jgi:hypothetical protein
MFRVLWNAVARWARREKHPEWVRRAGREMRYLPFGSRTVHFVRVCRPCRHLSVDGYKYDTWSNEMFPVWNLVLSNRWGFSRVGYVGDCRYFRVPVPNWFGKWLHPIVTRNGDGWWFGNERTSDWYRYRDVRVNEEREELERA